MISGGKISACQTLSDKSYEWKGKGVRGSLVSLSMVDILKNEKKILTRLRVGGT